MRLRIYPDTSVLGGCFDDEFNEWSKQLIEDFIDGSKIVVISDLTLKELEQAPDDVRNIINKIPNSNTEFVILEDESKALAEKYILEDIVTRQYIVDAQHIAMATISKVDILVSWNFKHIVNFNRIRLYNSVNLKYGYSMIEIRSPREIL